MVWLYADRGVINKGRTVGAAFEHKARSGVDPSPHAALSPPLLESESKFQI